jgi:ATP-dependent exoDNAse (exonuclease V) alpha subunit
LTAAPNAPAGASAGALDHVLNRVQLKREDQGMTEFSEAQQSVLSVLEDTEESVLITGVAGCGKSTIIRHWLSMLAGACTMLLAPTGVAALNVGGSTIHRAFGFRPNMNMDNPHISLKVRSALHGVRTIVIDEVSMVRADMLHAMDVVLRSVKRKLDVPFGGVRVIMVGDFYQLPPVVRREEEREMERKHGSRAGWAFYAPVFEQLDPRIFYLSESFRQAGDDTFTGLLNRVRQLDETVADDLNQIARPADSAPDAVPFLCARKREAAVRNAQGLKALGVPAVSIAPVITGDATKAPKDAKEVLTLAEGARVMITRNGRGYVNGSLGTLASFDATTTLWDGSEVEAIEVRLDTGYSVCVPREESEVIGYKTNNDGELEKDVLATISQYPLSLGYAWTIHKSQGQTLDRAVIDLGQGAFAHGQTYVGLSRLRTTDGLYLASDLTRSDLLLDPDVVEFFREHTV